MSTLLIKNGRVVTLNAQNEILENAGVFIEDTKIVEIGAIPEGKYTADRVIDAAGRVVMPGLINAHHHLYSIFARGFGAPASPPASCSSQAGRHASPSRRTCCRPRCARPAYGLGISVSSPA